MSFRITEEDASKLSEFIADVIRSRNPADPPYSFKFDYNASASSVEITGGGQSLTLSTF